MSRLFPPARARDRSLARGPRRRPGGRAANRRLSADPIAAVGASNPAHAGQLINNMVSIYIRPDAFGDRAAFDAEHGHLDWKEILDHLRALSRSTTVGLVRIAALDAALVKRPLDLGADGVVVPWIESAAQVREV